jgi:segregation and condensation protein A
LPDQPTEPQSPEPQSDDQSQDQGDHLPEIIAGQEPVSPEDAADAAADPYGIRLGVFEGPLDLLLYLIRKNEVDIYDIPVATITNQYLAFLSTGVHLLDLEQAADFILMAATLMKVKSQMLLPRDIDGEDVMEDGFGDPREDLVRRLLEYQQFKDIAGWLGDQGLEQRDVFQRPGHLDESDAEAGLHPVSLFDLLKVYKHVIDQVPTTVVHRVVEEGASVEDSVTRILSELDSRSRIRFHELVAGESKVNMVATFIGLLELLKSQRIRVQQAQPFDDIWIEGRAEDDRTLPAEDADEDTDDAEPAEPLSAAIEVNVSDTDVDVEEEEEPT